MYELKSYLLDVIYTNSNICKQTTNHSDSQGAFVYTGAGAVLFW